ncbi:MGMT family protein [Aliifodinibius sp. S!AR15-10]|uniref:MGMT family protein n=1 Tax=Aliifodinibius sp. S!AR15-10 TaxID=2950437 RepID=UPI0028558B5A|nr:MGMT family protein [Aliifodinibius sp. S!AR15-10]MDR8391786.1 MGMT family protein [Aliifodinibius sp. S!AR15-10]
MPDGFNRKDFYKRVYEVVAQIPKGKVTTYGAIASYLGVVSGARMVGYALNKAVETEIPAHRVLNRLGELTGRAHFPDDTMRERLQQENITFVAEYTVDIEQHFWDPSEAKIGTN